MTLFTRRKILAGAPVAAVAIALPAVAMAESANNSCDIELPVDKVGRLAFELSDALNDYSDGRFHAVVHPSEQREDAVVFTITNLPPMSPEARMKNAAYEYKRAAMEIDPTCTEWWDAKAEDESLQMRFMLSGTRKEVRS